MKHPLSTDERYELEALISHPGFKALLRLVEALVLNKQTDLVKFDLSTGDERELVRRKCRAEGAAQLQAALKRELELLKTKQGSKPS